MRRMDVIDGINVIQYIRWGDEPADDPIPFTRRIHVNLRRRGSGHFATVLRKIVAVDNRLRGGYIAIRYLQSTNDCAATIVWREAAQPRIARLPLL